jgi:hypothetical protein
VSQLTSILAKHPEIMLTNISALRGSIATAPSSPVKFGELIKKIYVDISSDGLTAEVTFNMSSVELSAFPKENLINELKALLDSHGIVFGSI